MFARHIRPPGKIAILALVPLTIGSVSPRVNFDNRILLAQNEERELVGVPPLAWDPELADGAQEWADHLSANGKFEHSPDDPDREPIGENIWGGTPGYFVPEQMVAKWAEEKKYFRSTDFSDSSTSGRIEDVSHYTQVVWRHTTHVGCGSSDLGGEEILVCRYRTAGNVLGQQVY